MRLVRLRIVQVRLGIRIHDAEPTKKTWDSAPVEEFCTSIAE